MSRVSQDSYVAAYTSFRTCWFSDNRSLVK